jgi:hypothetical protein
MAVETNEPSKDNLSFIDPGMTEELEYYSDLVEKLIKDRDFIEK